MFDGIQRPLDAFEKVAQSPFLTKGVSVTSLNRERVWDFNPTVKVGDKVEAGDVIGTVQETPVVLHKIMVPFGIDGNAYYAGTYLEKEQLKKLNLEALQL